MPAALEEVDGIVRTGAADQGVLEGERLVDAAFTREALVGALKKKFKGVHIASRFVLDQFRADRSYLVLGDGTRLPLLDIRNDSAFTFSDADLVTLSACRTALGGRYGDGAEIDSLGAIAQDAGAPAVIASLWSVEDASTADLMVRFYQNRVAGGMGLAEALRAAQLEFARGTAARDAGEGEQELRHPFYWAPFIVIGNWQ